MYTKMTIISNGLISAMLLILLFSLCNSLEQLRLKFAHRLPGVHIRSVVSVTIRQCHGECLARKKCKSYNYFSNYHLCKLIEWDSQSYTLEKDPGSVYAEKRSWEKKTVSSLCDTQCKDIHVCRLNPDTSVSCLVSECPSPVTVDRARILGNMLHVGAQVLYRCESQSEPDPSVPDPVVTSECLHNGTWSTVSIKCRPKVKYLYVGCYNDSSDRSFPDIPPTESNGMTSEVCYSYCKSKHASYFGTQFEKQCYCGENTYTKNGGQRSDDECNMACAGNAAEMCGASWKMSIYKIQQ